MNKLVLSFFAALLLLAASSCHKCPDNVAPVISVTTPTEGGTVQLPDSVRIEGTVSDDVWLNDMSVVIHDANDDTAYISAPDVYGKKEHSFTYSFFTTTAGTFHLHVSATDNEGVVSEKEAVFTVAP